jgi:branched-chain amino acid transport system ATP-binding protein
VTAGYQPDAAIVHEVTHSFELGTVTLVIGPNGAGKSTLIKTIVGLTKLIGGDISVDGIPVSSRRVSERIGLGVSFCPQGRANFPSLTVGENLKLAGYTLSRQILDERLSELRARHPLVDRRWTERIGNLSGGEQQRIELAMALLTRPRVLLLDEPSLGLSPAASREIFQEVRAIADGGVCVIIVEQNVRAVVPIADRLIVLEQGVTVLDGEPEHVLTDPELRRVYLGAVGASANDAARLVGAR